MKKMGITKVFEVQATLRLSQVADQPKSIKSIVAFLSHVKKESGIEVSVVTTADLGSELWSLLADVGSSFQLRLLSCVQS